MPRKNLLPTTSKSVDIGSITFRYKGSN